MCIKFAQMNGDEKYFDSNDKYTHFLRDKISNIIKLGFDSQPVYNDKCIKSKIDLYNDKLSTNCCGNDITRWCALYIFFYDILKLYC